MSAKILHSSRSMKLGKESKSVSFLEKVELYYSTKSSTTSIT
jgi:hypothetical protein